MSTTIAVALESPQSADVPTAVLEPQIEKAILAACAKIAPTWPLDRFIAVNPFWGLIKEPLDKVAAQLQSLSGAQLLMPRAFYRDAYREGRIRDEHLQAAIDIGESKLSVLNLRALLEQDEPNVPRRALVVDIVDAERDLIHEVSWRSFITQDISQFCAAYFDDGQARLNPRRDSGLYASWRRHASSNRSPVLLMNAKTYRTHAADLPLTARDIFNVALPALDIPSDQVENYLWSLLLDQNGWASWCAYRRWIARLEGADDDAIIDFLAIRLAWEWILHRVHDDVIAQRWSKAITSWPRVDAGAAACRRNDWLLQMALEIAWREPVLRALPAGLRIERPKAASVQAVFCIDVRSEVFRRAFEATTPSVQTLGFAGFFGVPMDYLPLAAPSARPQLPGLLAPRLRATDIGLEPNADKQRSTSLDLSATWRAFKSDAMSMFAFVEAFGLTYASDLIKDSLGLGSSRRIDDAALSSEQAAKRKPRLVGTSDGQAMDLAARCDLAAGILRGMSLTHDFARLVLLVGHGSTTRNNPHAAGLDCGACCGQTGEANARVAASLLNEPAIRQGLSERGIQVPTTTWFVPALHNTTTDDIELFDLDELPSTHRADLDTLRGWLIQASVTARSERAVSLGLDPRQTDVDAAIRARSKDWAQVRPEWGLANNAAFIVAPREHCRHLDLKGRSFLHEYRHREDEGFRVLELIMTAPMVVTHWINFQYYASTVDNPRYGSGNKVLHNVVGGHIGVFEGNGGDLRIGLPLQSLHDGNRWIHTPLRSSVFIEAPRTAIDSILDKHAHVRDLVSNGWIFLFQIDDTDGAIYAFQNGSWHRQTPLLFTAHTEAS
jgi:uncharacterized protein